MENEVKKIPKTITDYFESKLIQGQWHSQSGDVLKKYLDTGNG